MKIAFVRTYLAVIFIAMGVTVFGQANKESKNNIEKLKARLAKTNNDSLKIVLLHDLAFEYNKVNNVQAINTAEQGYKLAKETRSPSNKALMAHVMGKVYTHDDPEKAIEYFEIALREYKKLKNISGQRDALSGLGVCFMYSGDYKKATYYQIESLKLSEQLHENNSMSLAYSNLVAINAQLGEYREALRFGFKALELKENSKDYTGIETTYGNIGTCYYNLGLLDSSNYYLYKSLAIRKKNNDKGGLALVYNNLAANFSEKKDFKRSLDFLNLSKEIYEQINDKPGLSMCIANMGDLYYLMQDYKKALTYAQQGLELAKKANSAEDLKNSLNSIGLIYEKLGDLKSALYYFKEFTKLKDSLMNKESAREISEIKTKFETVQKENKIRILENDKQIQQLEIENKESDLKKQKGFLIIVSIGLIIVLILSFFIFKSYKEKKKANEALQDAYNIIEEKNHIVEEKQKEILDSIQYAKRIQKAHLPTDSFMDKQIGRLKNKTRNSV
jgi:tetratricopeptide (TPR) repeat protein